MDCPPPPRFDRNGVLFRLAGDDSVGVPHRFLITLSDLIIGLSILFSVCFDGDAALGNVPRLCIDRQARSYHDTRNDCRSNSAPERIFQSHRISPLHLGCPAGSLPAPAAYLCFEDTTSATFCQDLLLKYNKSSPLRRLRASSPKGGNNDDRRQRRKQGGAVGAAASKTQAERSGCWEPQPGCEAPLACRATLR